MKTPSTRRLLFKMGMRSLRQGIAQFLSIIAIGGIALTLFVGLLSSAESFSNRVETVYREGNLPDLWVTTETVDEDDLSLVEGHLEEGDAIEGRLYLPVSVNQVTTYGAIVGSYPTIDKPWTIIEEEKTDDFLYLDQTYRKKSETDVGSKFSVGEEVSLSLSLTNYDLSSVSRLLSPFVKRGGSNVFAGDSLDLPMKVTGFMGYPENIAKSAYNNAVTLIADSAFRKAFQEVLDENYASGVHSLIYAVLSQALGFHSRYAETLTAPNQYLVRLADSSRAETLAKSIRADFTAKEEDNLYAVTTQSDMPFYATLSTDLTQAKQFTFVFPMVFFLVAVLVILTTLSQMILRERTQIGTLKALGVSKGKIYGHYVKITLFLTGLGALIGEILGPLIIPAILGNKYSILYSLPAMQWTFPWLYGLLSAFVFLGISAVVTVLVCHKEISLKPVDSMRPEPPAKALKPRKRQSKKALGLSLAMAMRNIRLDKRKAIMVIIGVMGCTALLTTGFGIDDTINYGIDHDMAAFHNTDIAVTYSSSLSKQEAINALSSVDGISTIEPAKTTSGVFFVDDGPQVQKALYFLSTMDSSFQVSFGVDEVAISQKIARSTGAKVGDMINFRYDGVTYKAKVGVVYEAFFYHGLMIHEQASCLQGLNLTYNQAYVNVKTGENVSFIDEQIEALPDVSKSETMGEWKAYIDGVMSSIRVMTTAVKVFAILLAVVVLYNLALMNFRQRARDIATLKVLGFRRYEIALSLISETMLLTALGVAFGLALGYPFLLAVMGTNIVELVEYLYVVAPLSYFLSFLLTFVVAFAVNFVLSLRIRSVKMVESLKSIE